MATDIDPLDIIPLVASQLKVAQHQVTGSIESNGEELHISVSVLDDFVQTHKIELLFKPFHVAELNGSLRRVRLRGFNGMGTARSWTVPASISGASENAGQSVTSSSSMVLPARAPAVAANGGAQ